MLFTSSFIIFVFVIIIDSFAEVLSMLVGNSSYGKEINKLVYLYAMSFVSFMLNFGYLSRFKTCGAD